MRALTQSVEKNFFHRAKYVEKKNLEKITIDTIN